MKPKTKRLGKRSGPKATFTRAEVIAATLKLNLYEFTMSDVAKQLGVVTSALYRVFENRDALVDACLERVASRLQMPPADLPWPEQLRQWGLLTWRLCEDHPGLAMTLTSFPAPHVHMQENFLQTLERLQASGFPGSEDDAIFMLKIIGDTMLNSFMTRENALRTNSAGVSNLELATQKFAQLPLATQSRGVVMAPNSQHRDKTLANLKLNFLVAAFEAGTRPEAPPTPEFWRTRPVANPDA